jgi:hypothetical protein
MAFSFSKSVYHGLCALASLMVASAAILPMSAATANALSYRGGGGCGCHNNPSRCGGGPNACAKQAINICLTADSDNNKMSCGKDSGVCATANTLCHGEDQACQ